MTDTICQRLAQRRKELGLSVEQLAKLAGISGSTVAMMERGERGASETGRTTASASMVFALADALQCDPRWLSSGDGALPPPALDAPKPTEAA